MDYVKIPLPLASNEAETMKSENASLALKAL